MLGQPMGTFENALIVYVLDSLKVLVSAFEVVQIVIEELRMQSLVLHSYTCIAKLIYQMKKSQSQFMIRSKESVGSGRGLEKQITELQTKASGTVREIEFAYEKLTYLDQEIKQLSQKLSDLRQLKQQQAESQSVTDHSAKEELEIARQKHARLVQSSNDTQARNGVLRNTVDNLR